MGDLLRFPVDRRSPSRRRPEAALIIVLPVVRIERYEPPTAEQEKIRRRIMRRYSKAKRERDAPNPV